MPTTAPAVHDAGGVGWRAALAAAALAKVAIHVARGSYGGVATGLVVLSILMFAHALLAVGGCRGQQVKAGAAAQL